MNQTKMTDEELLAYVESNESLENSSFTYVHRDPIDIVIAYKDSCDPEALASAVVLAYLCGTEWEEISRAFGISTQLIQDRCQKLVVDQIEKFGIKRTLPLPILARRLNQSEDNVIELAESIGISPSHKGLTKVFTFEEAKQIGEVANA